jgi:hypothetical protein
MIASRVCTMAGCRTRECRRRAAVAQVALEPLDQGRVGRRSGSRHYAGNAASVGYPLSKIRDTARRRWACNLL